MADAPNSTRSPAHRVARVGRDVVQEVLLTVKSLPRRVDRTAIVSDPERATAGLTEPEQSPIRAADHLDLLEQARKNVKTAANTIEGRDGSDASIQMATRLRAVGKTLDQVRDATIDAVVARQDDVEAAMGRRLQIPDAEPFAVSLGVPRLHALDRELMRSRVDIAPDELIYEDEEGRPEVDEPDPDQQDEGPIELEPLPDPKAEEPDEETFGGDDPAKRLPLLVADADATPTLMSPGLPGEIAQLERSVRACLEDIGAMGTLRRLYDYERFDIEGMQRFESRMCTALDAAVALTGTFFTTVGPGARFSDLDLLDLAVRYGREGATADPHRAFARAFVLGSIAGDDTVRAALLALRQSAPYTYPAQADALILAPNPAVGPAMQNLCTDDDPRLAALALHVLTERNEVDFGVVVPLLEHPSEEVRLAAVRALGRAKEREAACKVLADMIATELDDDVYIGGAEALTSLGSQDGLLAIRERLIDIVEDDEYSMRADLVTRCMQVVAVAGIADDYMLLERVYFGDPGQPMALGFHGHPALVERLVASLDQHGGLYLGPRAKIEAARALSRITGAPLFRRRDDRDIDPYDVIADRAQWQTWWEENQGHYDTATRYRFGKPYVAHQTVAELGRDGAPVGIRKMCALELGVQLRCAPFPTHDYVAKQREALGHARASTEAAFAGGELKEGSWPKLAL